MTTDAARDGRDVEREKQVVVAYWDEVWTQGDPTAPARFYAEEATENGDEVVATDFAAAVQSWRQKFPDFRVDVVEVLQAEDRVLSRVVYRGTHRGTWAGIPATGRSFAVLGLDLWRLRDERIVEHWHVTDHLELVTALGGEIVPPRSRQSAAGAE